MYYIFVVESRNLKDSFPTDAAQIVFNWRISILVGVDIRKDSRFSKVVTLSGSVEHCGSSTPLKILTQLTQLHSILARPGDATQTTLRPCWQTQPAAQGLLAPAGRPPPVLVPLA